MEWPSIEFKIEKHYFSSCFSAKEIYIQHFNLEFTTIFLII